MKEQLELNQLIYSIIKTQIEFGTYRFEEHLPPIEEMADILVVSCRQMGILPFQNVLVL